MIEATLVQNSLQLYERLWEHIGNPDIPADTRSRFASGAFRHTMDCHHAMVLLKERHLHGPSFALVRVICEALATGFWSYLCAKEARLSQIEKDPSQYTFEKNTINDIRRHPRFASGRRLQLRKFLCYHMGSPDNQSDKALTAKSKAVWKAMNSYTHGSYWQIVNYQSEESIAPNFDDDVVREVIRFSNCCGCWAAIGICEIANQENSANTIYRECLAAI